MDWKSIFLDRVLFQTALKKPDQNHFPKVKSNSFIVDSGYTEPGYTELWI
ncbi:13205_t:CDS:2, partial [Entrophospora sp. SA101]